MAKCKECIHKDVCYLKEHYGKDLCSDEACDKFLATPVVHGRWIPQFVSSRGLADMFSCSVCNGSVFTSHKYSSCPYKYCNHCGAKMDGGDTYD